MSRYPLELARREVAFIAYHFHWSRESLMEIPHLERREWVDSISRMNEEMNQAEREALS